MTFYIPFAVIAIGLSMYAFYSFKKRRDVVTEHRRVNLKETRQSWLEHYLGIARSDIVLYGEFMEQKIPFLKNIGTDNKRRETYYIDEESGDKWIKEYVLGDDSWQLRKVGKFRFE